MFGVDMVKKTRCLPVMVKVGSNEKKVPPTVLRKARVDREIRKVQDSRVSKMYEVEVGNRIRCGSDTALLQGYISPWALPVCHQGERM